MRACTARSRWPRRPGRLRPRRRGRVQSAGALRRASRRPDGGVRFERCARPPRRRARRALRGAAAAARRRRRRRRSSGARRAAPVLLWRQAIALPLLERTGQGALLGKIGWRTMAAERGDGGARDRLPGGALARKARRHWERSRGLALQLVRVALEARTDTTTRRRAVHLGGRARQCTGARSSAAPGATRTVSRWRRRRLAARCPLHALAGVSHFALGRAPPSPTARSRSARGATTQARLPAGRASAPRFDRDGPRATAASSASTRPTARKEFVGAARAPSSGGRQPRRAGGPTTTTTAERRLARGRRRRTLLYEFDHAADVSAASLGRRRAGHSLRPRALRRGAGRLDIHEPVGRANEEGIRSMATLVFTAVDGFQTCCCAQRTCTTSES